MHSKNIKISVVTIVFNDADHILATVGSVGSQTARANIEYIVVDGASTDGTSELLERQSSDIDIYIREKDSGIYNAMNKGLRAATGDYVIFMNSGDRFSDHDVVRKVVESIAGKEKLPAMVYGHYRECLGEERTFGVKPSRQPDKIWYGPVASHQSTFYNLAFLKNNNLVYDESFRIAADYRLTLETLVRSRYDALRLDLCISDFDISGVSNTNQDQGLREANRVRREVLAWGPLRTGLMTGLLLGARYTKRYLNPLYTFLRNR